MAIIRHSFKSTTNEPAPIETLPFVVFIDGRHYYWHVPPESGYVAACDAGVQYACDYIQYLKDNPFWVGMGFTSWIFRDMAKIGEDTREKGYAVGFAAVLERALCLVAENIDHYAYEQAVERWQAETMRELGYRKPKRKGKK